MHGLEQIIAMDKKVEEFKYRDDRPVVYISGPMTAPNGWLWEQNIRRAEEIGFEIIGLGGSAVVPQSMGRFFKDTYDRTIWMENDISLMSKCDGAVFIPGWQNSQGANDEMTYALLRKIPLLRVDDPPWNDEMAKCMKVFLAGLKEK